jgi:hypothetical protein
MHHRGTALGPSPLYSSTISSDYINKKIRRTTAPWSFSSSMRRGFRRFFRLGNLCGVDRRAQREFRSSSLDEALLPRIANDTEGTNSIGRFARSTAASRSW